MKKLFSLITLSLISVIALLALCPSSAEQNSSTNSQQRSKVVKSLNADQIATTHLDSVVLGAGCFWGAEKRYQAIPGVVDAVSGYADGNGVKADYRTITQRKNRFNENNHAEVVEVTFNRSMVSLETILRVYFETHDPTQLNRQGNDIGTQYRSTILTNSAQQLAIAKQVSDEFQVLLTKAKMGAITTKIKPLETFYPAEEYHQDYLVKNPNGYCPDHSTGVKFDASHAKTQVVDNQKLMQGKQIVVIDSDDYCPYCEKFKTNVAKDYQGSIPMTFRLASQLDGLTIKTPTWATPTVLFLEDGKEVYGRQGYMSAKDFYKALGAFKLGDSEAYDVAFDKGTDNRYCKQYEIFKNTPDGIFVDKLSGAPLFDTRDRFNSRTGWLSFTKAVDDSTIERPDYSYGMTRVEVRSKSSNIHLGHVFPDGPNGQPRFCINATVLEFVPRESVNS